MTIHPAAWIEIGRVANRRKAREHALVLAAQGIPHALAQQVDSIALLVPAQDEERARAELERYERENLHWPPHHPPVVVHKADALGALVYALLLVALFAAQQRHAFGVDWTAAGRSTARLVREGEWWRTITALSLHGDLPHLAGNVVFGSFFCILLAQVLGPGVGWGVVLLSGALGNLANALVQDPTHASIGASTAIFGALGALAVRRLRDRRSVRRRHRFGPLFMAIVVLGFIGFPNVVPGEERPPGEPQVDVMAHACGFVAGALLGLSLPRDIGGMARVQRLAALLVPVVLVAAWALALG